MIEKVKQSEVSPVGSADVGVVLCDCGGTLRSRIDFGRVKSSLEQLPSVKVVEVCSDFCQQDGCSKVVKNISGKKVNRLVVGACDDRIFADKLGQENINEGLLWCSNIREHCAWVHNDIEAATDKSIDVLAAAVRRVNAAEAVESSEVAVNQDVLVLGADTASMQAAIALSKLGHKVTLACCGKKLGASAAEAPELYGYIADDSFSSEQAVRKHSDELVNQLVNDSKVKVLSDSSFESLTGEFGSFSALLSDEKAISIGAVVLGDNSPLLNSELTKLIQSGNVPRRIAIMVDIAGQQDCSVTAQVLSAAELLVSRFGSEVKVYCNNVRVAAGGMEKLYQRTRQAGVVITKYESTPVVVDGGLTKRVTVIEPVAGCEITEEFDLVIEADRAVYDGNGGVNIVKGLTGGANGDLQADGVWLLPVKTNLEGVFVVGGARNNFELREAQSDGLAVADEIHEMLRDKTIKILDDAAVVDSEKCVLCLTCVRTCPHGAIDIDDTAQAAVISALRCQRCGICAAQCPANAIELPRYTTEQITAEIGDKPKITIFACENSAFPAATAVGINGAEYDAKVRLIRVPCAGKVDPKDVMRAIEYGAEKVVIAGCHRENCKYLTGSSRAVMKIKRLADMFERAGLDKEKVSSIELASVEPAKFLEYVKELK